LIPLYDVNRSLSRPIVTILLIAINVAVFAYQFTLEPYSLDHMIRTYGLIPARAKASTFLTSMFLHGGWLHLIGNMWFLWIYGDNVEDTLGRWKYLLFYLGCGFAAAMAQFVMNPASTVPMVGASGAIAGVMGAYVVKFPHARIVMLVFLFVFVTTIEVPAIFVLGYWLLIQLVSGMGSIADMQLAKGGVAFFAHIGGFLAGVILIKLLPTHEPYWRRQDLRW
jgi:membrane associated rhomboid family serine protease